MKIALISDLHFGGLGEAYEHLVASLRDSGVDLIINAGDYSNEYNSRVITAVDGVCNSIAPTVSVYGNHDYYNSSVRPEVDAVDFVCVGDDVVVISATLWTDYFGGDYLEEMESRRYLADFRYIRDWTTDRQINLHNNQLAEITALLKQFKDRKIIVVTHHAPTTESVHPRFRGKGLNGSFVNRLEEFILDHPQIKVWCHGHVHDDVDIKIGETRILCHPRGYRGESNYNNYEPKVFEL